MNCIIIEDQPPAQRVLKKYIEDVGSLNLKATFSSAIEAMEFLRVEQVDLIFLDIHLPKISGIDFLKSLKNPPHIILTTAFAEYALESYEFNVVDYLLKPFSFQRFVKAIAKLPWKEPNSMDLHGPENFRTTLYIKSGYDHIKIAVSDILYIKSDADYTEIHTAKKKYLSSEPLRHWLQTFNNDLFFRVHKSFIINTAKIKKVSGKRIILVSETEIPIGRAYKDEFISRFIQ